MNPNSEPPKDNESKGARETLSWMLDILTKASKVRKNFYKKQQKIAEESARAIKIDIATGAVVENADSYCAAHANLLFLTHQTIESFHGTLTAASSLSRKADFLKVCSILLDPTNDKGGIISRLKEGAFSSKDRFSMMAIPRIDRFSEPHRSELNRLLTSCFTRFDLYARYSIEYLSILKSARDVYAHNYRFIFPDVAAPPEKPEFDESVVSLLPRTIDESLSDDSISPSTLMTDMKYVGFLQRLATGKLVSELTMFEQWIYMNMRNRLWNNDAPVLPENVPYLSKDDLEMYSKIRESQGYDFVIPKRTDYGEYNKNEQELLHKRFLFDLQSQGDKFKLRNLAGREIPLKFRIPEESDSED
ncbi:MAG: hypothetical protein ACFFER_01135 [Candidatus Thorarchaeota archaeon]